MNAAARDTRLPLQARAIAFWILDNPGEGIDPDIIAQANNLAASYVRKLLAKLAEFGHLIAPRKVRGERGRFVYTPYALPPQDKITSTVAEPARSETPHGENNQSGTDTPAVSTSEPEAPQDKITGVVEISAGSDSHSAGTTEPAYTHTRAAGDKDGLLSLKTSKTVLSETEKDRTDVLKLEDTRAQDDAPVDDTPVYQRTDGLGQCVTAYLERIGQVGGTIGDDIADTIKDYGWYAVKMAIHTAADEKARAQRGERAPIRKSTWSYALGILSTQKSEGDLPVEPVNIPDVLPVEEIPEPEPDKPALVILPPVDDRDALLWRELLTLIGLHRSDWETMLAASVFKGVVNGTAQIAVKSPKAQNVCETQINHHQWLEKFGVFPDGTRFEFVLEGAS